MVCLDAITITCHGWTSGIEACDFFSDDKQFIHIKHEASSSKLSHLFQQGVVSAEAFRREREFREKLKALVIDKNESIAAKLPDPDTKPQDGEFEVVFAVIRKPHSDGSMSLPFFSKVSLRNAARHLQDLGYRVSFSWIRKGTSSAAEGGNTSES